MTTAPDFLIRTSSVGLSIIIIIIIIIIISHSFPTSPLKQTYVRPPPIRLQTFRLEFATFDPPRKKTDHQRTKRRLSQVKDPGSPLEVGTLGNVVSKKRIWNGFLESRELTYPTFELLIFLFQKLEYISSQEGIFWVLDGFGVFFWKRTLIW